MRESDRRGRRNLVCPEGVEPTRFPASTSSWCVCHSATGTLVDCAGIEPALRCRALIKSQVPNLSANSPLGDASGYDPHAYGLKVRSLSIRV